jgi:hypothetical protein
MGLLVIMKAIFLPFEESREHIRKLNFSDKKEYREYCKSGNKPNNIPSAPDQVYKNEWKGWGDWLGTGTISPQNKIFLPFEESRDCIRKLNFSSQKEYREYCKSGNKPNNIPSAPDQVYKNEWKGWGDWLGTGTIASFNKIYLPFEESRDCIRKLNFSSQKEYREYCKSGNKPNNIPSNPDKVYKNEWKGWGDWLGTGAIAPQNKIYLPFEEARDWIRKEYLPNCHAWEKYCKSGNKPNNIPSAPDQVYKNEWRGWHDWLGNRRRISEGHFLILCILKFNEIAYKEEYKFPDCKYKQPLKFDFAVFMGKKLIGLIEYQGEQHSKLIYSNNSLISRIRDKIKQQYCLFNEIPILYSYYYRKRLIFDDVKSFFIRIGFKEDIIFPDDDFIKKCHEEEKKYYLLFPVAREHIRKLNFSNKKEYDRYCKSGEKPSSIPATPDKVYKNEWISWGDWLGTGAISSRKKIFLPFEESREYIRKQKIPNTEEWYEYCKSGKKPDNIPVCPNRKYKSKWKGWADWLGK